MGKKKNAPMDFLSDDDTLSTISSGSSVELGSRVDEVDSDTVLQSLIDALFEKRTATRESALRGLLGAFTSDVMTNFVDQNYETLLNRFLASIKKGSSMERALAARALCLQALTAGPGEIADQIMAEAWPHLVKVAKHDSSPNSRVAAIETMGFLPFVADVDLEVTENSMDAVWQICSHKGNYHSEQVTGVDKPSGEVRRTAISAWALLLSTIPTARIATHYATLSLPTFSKLLKDDDSSVRQAAGEAVALLHDAITVQGGDFTTQTTEEIWDNPAFVESKDQFTPNVVASAGKGLEDVEAKIVGQMKNLSVKAGGKGQSRTDRYSERTTFKDLISHMEDGEFRQTSVKLQGGDYLRINNWTQTIQFRALRHVLAEGFQCHLQDNELLHAIFGYKPRALTKKTMSKKEKRLYMSPNSVISKARTQSRNSDRSKVQEGNEGHFNANFIDV